MARTVAELPKGARITDHISLGVLTKTFPLDKVTAAVAAADKSSQRQRDLPAHVVVYYVMALTLYTLACVPHAGFVSRGAALLAGRRRSDSTTRWSPPSP